MKPHIAILLLLLSSCARSEKTSPELLKDVDAVLDDWHSAASRADETRYLQHLAEDAIFIGTDPAERWNKDEFQQYVHPYFAKGRGWTYVPRDRHAQLSPDRRIAWFDERLDNEKYGVLRGTGVMRFENDTWKIVHYSMTFPIPNEKTRQVMEIIAHP